MTEEIIIDGVNVAGCVDFCAEDCDCCNANNHNIGCGQYSDCYYKQLKRLEQENKEIYENGQIEITKLCNEKTKYRSALEEIRGKVNQSYQMADRHIVLNIINEVLND